ncbi:Mlp family lipoprotein, partial [Borrelia persica]|uniref:Mlp family lipoprotein n=1 Tax=Borrelia persica TaxID=44448 RepID=UPI0004665865
NIILILLLMINSCDQYKQKNTDNDKPQKDEAEQTEEVAKTPEEILKEKLNDTQKQGLDLLKEALGDNDKLNQLLSLDENKIKEALEHIQSELNKCTGDNASDQKSTFKTVIKEYLKSNNDNLDQFKEQTSSNCGEGAGA